MPSRETYLLNSLGSLNFTCYHSIRSIRLFPLILALTPDWILRIYWAKKDRIPSYFHSQPSPYSINAKKGRPDLSIVSPDFLSYASFRLE